MNPNELTVVVLARDEERAIRDALASAPSGARLFVLDAESKDRTAQLSAEAGARVIVRPWTNFVDARRFALAQVETPWTFMLDADERLDPALQEALLRSEPERDGVEGYRVRRATRFCGAVVAAFGWDDEPLLRVFRTSRATVQGCPAAGGNAPLHERWSVPGEIADLDGRLLHDSYPDRATYRRKFVSYTDLEAQGLRGGLAALAGTALLAPARMLWMLGPRGGWRAGWRGWYLAFWSSLYPVAVRWKALRRR